MSHVSQDEKIGAIIRIFIAPEVLQNNHDISDVADVWSIGATLYYLISSQVLNAKQSDRYQDIFSFQEPEWSNIAPNLKQFIQGCLIIDHKKRPQLKQL